MESIDNLDRAGRFLGPILFVVMAALAVLLHAIPDSTWSDLKSTFLRGLRLWWRLFAAPIVGTAREVVRAYREYSGHSVTEQPKDGSWNNFFTDLGTDIPERDSFVLLTVDEYDALKGAAAINAAGNFNAEETSRLAHILADKISLGDLVAEVAKARVDEAWAQTELRLAELWPRSDQADIHEANAKISEATRRCTEASEALNLWWAHQRRPE